MSYLGIDPSLRAYKQALFRATGGETTLPIDIDVEALVIKNGSLLIPDNDYYINASNRIVVSKPALPGDEYFVINLSTFSFEGMATKKDLQDAIAGIEQQPLFFVMWWPKRSTIPAGFVPADGQLELRTTYKEAASQIDLGTMPFVTEADWLADPKLRASYTKGDGTTNFRMPDYNGKSQGGSAAVVLRGDGLNTDSAGSIQGDAMRVIEGQSAAFFRAAAVGDSGALKTQVYGPTPPMPGTPGAHQGDSVIIRFSNKDVVPTAPENRMVNTAGCWCVRLAHKVVATGVLDANGVVQSVNILKSDVSSLQDEVSGKAQVTLFSGKVYDNQIAEIKNFRDFERIIVVLKSLHTNLVHTFTSTFPVSAIVDGERNLVIGFYGGSDDYLRGWIDFLSPTSIQAISLMGSAKWSDIHISNIYGYR